MVGQSLPRKTAHGLSSAVTAWPAAFAARSWSTTPVVWTWRRWSGVPVAFWRRSRSGHRRVPDDPVVGGVGLGVGEGVALAARPEALLDVGHQRLVVGMDHERQAGRADGLEDLEQLAVVVDADAGHVRVVAAGVDDHEDLERRDAAGRRAPAARPATVAGGVDVPVDDRPLLVEGEHRVEPLDGVGRRLDVRHRERGRHAAGGAGARRGDDVLLVGEARLPVVGVDVDRPRQDVPAGRIDRPLGRRAACPARRSRRSARPTIARSASTRPVAVTRVPPRMTMS